MAARPGAAGAGSRDNSRMARTTASHHDRLKALLKTGRRRRELLPSGVTVLSEVIPGRQAVNFGVWVTNGSQGDSARESGLSHFLEHLVFKGSPRYSQKQISEWFDQVGGSLDAYTTREYIGFTGVVPGPELREGAGRLFDMILAPTFPARELEKERLVIVEECKMSDDNPESRIYDLLYEKSFPGSGLGRPIQGYLSTVTKIDRATVVKGHRAKFVPSQLIVAACGNFDADAWHRQVEKAFGKLAGSAAPPRERVAPPPAFVAVEEKADLAQSHLIINYPGFRMNDPRRWAAIVLDNAVGGTMSARLFQNLREKRGLCYSTYSNATFHADTGVFTFYAATSKPRTAEALELLGREIVKLRRAGITRAELDRSRRNLIGRTLLSLDTLSGRLTRAIMNEIAFRRQIPLAEVLEALERVNEKSVREACATLFPKGAAALVAVTPGGAIGPKERDLFAKILN